MRIIVRGMDGSGARMGEEPSATIMMLIAAMEHMLCMHPVLYILSHPIRMMIFQGSNECHISYGRNLLPEEIRLPYVSQLI